MDENMIRFSKISLLSLLFLVYQRVLKKVGIYKIFGMWDRNVVTGSIFHNQISKLSLYAASKRVLENISDAARRIFTRSPSCSQFNSGSIDSFQLWRKKTKGVIKT